MDGIWNSGILTENLTFIYNKITEFILAKCLGRKKVDYSVSASQLRTRQDQHQYLSLSFIFDCLAAYFAALFQCNSNYNF